MQIFAQSHNQNASFSHNHTINIKLLKIFPRYHGVIAQSNIVAQSHNHYANFAIFSMKSQNIDHNQAQLHNQYANFLTFPMKSQKLHNQCYNNRTIAQSHNQYANFATVPIKFKKKKKKNITIKQKQTIN